MEKKADRTAKARSTTTPARSACQERSERTRQRLIEVAVEVFADLGFHGAGTRTIVDRAQTNLVSIPYYFGSKLGLYHATAEYIGSNLAERFLPACERARQQLQQSHTHAQTLQHFIEFVVEFAEVMLGRDTPNSWAQFIIREQFEPTTAFEILHANFAPLLDVGFEYVARLTDRPADAPETRLQFFAVVAMVKFMRTDRAVVLRNTGWKSIGTDQLKIVTEMLRHNLETLFARRPS